MAVRRKLVVQLVEELLEKFQIKRAPVDVEKVTKLLGIEIQRDKVDADVSGFLVRDAKTAKALIGVNGAHPLYRQRFTIAHECGHYLLHVGETVHLDKERDALTVQFRDEGSSKGEDDSEREANLFAAELLMPGKFLKRDLQQGEDLLDEEGLRKLAKQYEVSVQALTFRLANLGYIRL
jgi:Zn-dependent peptidase ImmA (M78 family)